MPCSTCSCPDETGFSGFCGARNLSSVAGRDRVERGGPAGDSGSAVARAAGYLPKSTSKGELSLSIERVLSGSIAVPKNFVVKNDGNGADMTQAIRARLRELTPQQLRVLDLVRRGFQNKQIAVELKLAESTVKAHVTEILRKLKLFSRNKAVIEIGKISFTVPKQDSSKFDRAKPT